MLNRIGYRMVLAGFAWTGLIYGSASSAIYAQQQPDTVLQASARDDETNRTAKEYLPDESPALGLVIGACPGNAVCVLDTVWGSPAERSGIRKGDYLLSINDQQLSSPQQLREMLSQMSAGEEVSVRVWRGGQEFAKQMTLASKAEQRPDSHRAYLGVMLSSGQAERLGDRSQAKTEVTIERVVEGSPADRSKLRPGDVILEADGNKVESVEGFIESIEQKGPGSSVQLAILRDDQRKNVEVELGTVDEAPINFFRQAMRPQMDFSRRSFQELQGMLSPFGLNQGDTASGQNIFPDQQMMNQTLDDLRQRVMELEARIQELTQTPVQRGNGEIEDNSTDTDSPQKGRTEPNQSRKQQRNSPDNDLSMRSDIGSGAVDKQGDNKISRLWKARTPVTLVAQQRGLPERFRDYGPTRDRDWYRDRGLDRNWDWDRDWGERRRWERDDDDWRERYRSRYRERLYRSPRYGNQYYRYGGRPYYYGYGNYGINPYFSRPGIRFGNFGLYWF